MAELDNTSPIGGSNIAIEARRVMAEVTVILESVAAGLEAVHRLPEAVLIKSQIEILRGLVSRAVQTVEGFAEMLGLRTL